MQRAIVAEFQKNASKRLMLFALTAIEDHGDYLYRKLYDVDWSRRFGYLFHQSGAGGVGPVEVSGIYFVSGDVKVRERPCQLVGHDDEPPWRGRSTKIVRARNRTRRLRRLPRSFEPEPGKDLLDWLERHGIQEDAVYCSECRDNVPGDELCEHCWWCDQRGWYSTPSERCGCASREICDGVFKAA